jgi:23S rRNA (cytosine1962-C5)-methyltransferase
MIDSGNGRKLEAVGPYVLDRPETRAEHDPGLSEQEWEERTHARYLEDRKGTNGEWSFLKEMPMEWTVELRTEELSLKAECALGASKHYGFFPEQAENWDLIHRTLKGMEAPKALLLFAYTGMASLACRAAASDTYHVESSKATLNRARKNMERNGLSDIRWVLEDALKFAEREHRRGKRYQAIVLDPPSFGRGPNGELWKAEDRIPELFELCSGLLDPEEHLLIGNLYTDRSPERELLKPMQAFCEKTGGSYGLHDLFIPSEEGNGIDGGRCLRLEKQRD